MNKGLKQNNPFPLGFEPRGKKRNTDLMNKGLKP